MPRGAAFAAAKKMNKRGEFVNAYRCPICKRWHVGKMRKDQRVAAAFHRLDKLNKEKGVGHV